MLWVKVVAGFGFAERILNHLQVFKVNYTLSYKND